MNILYITPSIIPSNKANTVHVINMAIALIKIGHNVNLFVQSSCKSPNRYLSLDFGEMANLINVITYRPFCRRGVELFIALRAIIYYIGIEQNKLQSYVIISRNIFAACFFGILLSKRIVYETHTIELGIIRKRIQRLLLKKICVETVVISQALKNILLSKYPFVSGNIHVMHDAAFDDSPPFSRIIREKKRKEHFTFINDQYIYKYYAGYFGQLYAGRGIEIIENLARLNSSVLFIVYGGSEEDVLRFKMKNNMTNLIFMGHLPAKQIKPIMSIMDVLLMPYQKEVSIGVKGFDTALWMSPIKMFEYMSVGVPIISSDLPVLREILIDKHNCLLVDPEDLMCWSSALKKILYNKLFSDKISGIAYREFRQKYTWEFRAKNILSTLEY